MEVVSGGVGPVGGDERGMIAAITPVDSKWKGCYRECVVYCVRGDF